MPQSPRTFLRIFSLLGVALALPFACDGNTVCEDANDLCAATPDAPSFATTIEGCVDEDECLSQCVIELERCEPADLSDCEDLCTSDAGGGSP